MSVLGIIPARAGSKRLPRKNLLPLGGRPLIAHTCLAARQSGVFNALYVNTDSPDIAAAAEASGVTCPVLRPIALARDETPTRDAVLHMLNWLAQRGETYETLVLLQPTSPLRSCEDIVAALQLFYQRRPCSVVSVSPAAPRCWYGDVGDGGRLVRWSGTSTAYRLNGALYIYRMDAYIDDRQSLPTFAYVMPPERGIDIDTQLDLDLAECVLRRGPRTRETCEHAVRT